jgi:hypothetical protein
MTGPGIFYGDLVFGSQNPGDNVMTDTALLPYPDIPGTRLDPISLVLTDFHYLMLYSDRFQALSRLNNEIVYEERFNPADKLGQLRGVCRDPITGTVWLFSHHKVFEVFITNEDRHVWKLHLEQRLYDKALQFCKVSFRNRC